MFDLSNFTLGQRTLASLSDSSGPGYELAIVSVLFAIYAVGFSVAYSSLSDNVGTLSIVPVLASTWFFGTRGALVASVVALLISLFAIFVLAVDSFGSWVAGGSDLGFGALFAVAVIAGLLRDYWERAKTEIQERHVVEKALQRSYDELEERVERRTIELKLREEESRRLANENAVMAEIGRVVGSSLDLEQVYERFTHEVAKLVSFDRIAIIRVNEQQTYYQLAHTRPVWTRQAADNMTSFLWKAL